MDTQLKRGIVEICVLAALLKGEAYGYQLVKDLEGYIEISESTLYPILKRLESSNCLSVRSAEHNGRLRKYYCIQAGGRARLDEFLCDWQNIVKAIEFIKGECENEKK